MGINKVQGEWYSHAHAMSIAWELLKYAHYLESQHKESPTVTSPLHSFNARIASITYVAFALEGYLHLVGQLEIKKENNFYTSMRNWEKKPLKEKLTFICEKFNIKNYQESGPLLLVFKLIKFRNSQAHPKLVYVNETSETKKPIAIFDDLTIYRHIHPTEAEGIYNQVRTLVLQIEQARPDGNPDTWSRISFMVASESGPN